MATYHELMGFTNLPNGHWLKKDVEGQLINQIQFATMLGHKLGFTIPKDWLLEDDGIFNRWDLNSTRSSFFFHSSLS